MVKNWNKINMKNEIIKNKRATGSTGRTLPCDFVLIYGWDGLEKGWCGDLRWAEEQEKGTVSHSAGWFSFVRRAEPRMWAEPPNPGAGLQPFPLSPLGSMYVANGAEKGKVLRRVPCNFLISCCLFNPPVDISYLLCHGSNFMFVPRLLCV